ncbi:MAG: hypothetical protein WKG07_18875 [Hymenobacter sp.]
MQRTLLDLRLTEWRPADRDRPHAGRKPGRRAPPGRGAGLTAPAQQPASRPMGTFRCSTATWPPRGG